MVIPNHVRVVVVMWTLALAGGLLTLALLAKPAQAQVQPEHFSERVPFSSVVGVFCLGEEVSVEGTANVAGTYTEHADGRVQLVSHVNSVAKGVGLTSGDEYILREVSNYRHNVEEWYDPSSPQNFTQQYDLRIMRKGSAAPEDDAVIRFVFHITVAANGEVTATVEEWTEECT